LLRLRHLRGSKAARLTGLRAPRASRFNGPAFARFAVQKLFGLRALRALRGSKAVRPSRASRASRFNHPAFAPSAPRRRRAACFICAICAICGCKYTRLPMPDLELLPDPDPALAALARELERARQPSYPLTFVARRAPAAADAIAVADALAAEAGYSGLGAAWAEVPRRIAVKILAHVIGGELAYPEQVVPPERAADLAARFVALLPERARFFTNGALSGDFAIYDLAGAELLGWRSISAAPFDNGVVAVGAERALLLWAEDAP
jgi:hypothetical protein